MTKQSIIIGAITGYQLIRLLKSDTWQPGRKAKHGRCLWKKFNNHKRVTFVPETRKLLDTGTLAAILGPKQTRIGKNGLRKLIDKYGLG